MKDAYQTSKTSPLPLQPTNQRYGFVCHNCGRQRPWTDLEFSKDGTGRYRRVCRMCEMSYWSLQDGGNATVN